MPPIMQRPRNSRQVNVSNEMELEQQIVLMQDQQEIERRNLELKDATRNV